MGGMMVFPSNQIDGKLTINGARGFTRAISDRFDLTLECIRRHSRGGGESPLVRNAFRGTPNSLTSSDNFDGNVSFFLAREDLVADDVGVAFFMPFDDFRWPHVPQDASEYEDYRLRSIEFVVARNQRIAQVTGS